MSEERMAKGPLKVPEYGLLGYGSEPEEAFVTNQIHFLSIE
jgi:hypothetical protein